MVYLKVKSAEIKFYLVRSSVLSKQSLLQRVQELFYNWHNLSKPNARFSLIKLLSEPKMFMDYISRLTRGESNDGPRLK